MKNDVCFLAYTVGIRGYWARGVGIREAVENLLKQGVRKTDRCNVTIVVGDSGASINDMGGVRAHSGARRVHLLNDVRAWVLIHAERRK
jgi:hypothetical protein